MLRVKAAALAALGAALLLAPELAAQRKPAARGISPDIWVERTIRGMSLKEKVGQMVMVEFNGIFANEKGDYFLNLKRYVEGDRVGGLIIFRSEAYEAAVLINRLQKSAKVPLFIAADFERGAASLFPHAVSFPTNMGIGATGSEEFAYLQGKITGSEARALGIHWIYAPVSDVNNNPDNPIINIRSFGEDPEKVARLAAAFVRGAQEAGVIATAKHFPGHGDTAQDSHSELAVIDADKSRMYSVELVPFKATVEAGVDAIMTAHIALPRFAGEPNLPATLSQEILTDLLRSELGFKGLIVTDAMVMGGITNAYWTGEAAVAAVKAGADMVLMPPDGRVAIDALLRAVGRGEISEKRINESVRRILAAKAKLGLHRKKLVDIDALAKLFGDPENQSKADAMSDRSVTAVLNGDGSLPIDARRARQLFSVIVSDEPDSDVGSVLQRELARRAEDLTSARIDSRSSPEEIEAALDKAARADLIICSPFVRVRAWKGTVALPEKQARFVERLLALGKPVIVVAFGNPYVIRQFPQVRNYLCAYSYADVAQRSAARALFGEIAVSGKLPISLGPEYPAGSGLDIPRLDMTLADAEPEQAGISSEKLEPLYALIERGVEERAFPGAVLVVGRRGKIAVRRAFGAFDYSETAQPMTLDAIFDLASLTKVVGTTTAAMILFERRRLDLEMPVYRYIPEFGREGGKEKVKVKHLLTHSSGLPAYERLFLELKGKESFIKRICQMPLEYEPGSKAVYSDFGMILLGEIIERVTARKLDEFYRAEIFQPLGMRETMYRPPRSLLKRIPPTEDDPWRKRVVRGEVHDENTYAMGGISAHAGLFSTAGDLAKFCQMMLNGGIYDHRRILRRATIEKFTRRQDWVPSSSRAMGWDTPTPGGAGGSLLSASAYGHTGFTGTSIWIDPERELFVIFLTNRVHPTRENNKIREYRAMVHDAVVNALID